VNALDRWSARAFAQLITALQYTAAAAADGYVTAALLEQNIDPVANGQVNPYGFAGTAGDGRSLETLFDQPVIAAKTLIGQGLEPLTAWTSARNTVQMMAVTAVQDAGRGAAGVASSARPRVSGFVRMLTPPSCSRCAVLAGRWYRYDAGFNRHPRCDCIGVPANEDTSGDLRTDPRQAVESGNVTGLSRADTRAITDGADVSQVINAHRGMYTADAYGQRVKATQEGVTRHGLAGQRLRAQGGSYGRTPRLRPEAIYRLAGADRAEAIRLLTRFGYLT
jgi:hypothetical protein